MRFFLTFLGFIVILAMLTSCESIPPGEVPADGNLVENIYTPVNENPKKTDKDAVPQMLMSIVSECPPILTASTANPPLVINDFCASRKGRVNYMPMDLWTNLIKMKMISPVTECEKAQYTLSSEFTIQAEVEGKTFFLWKMKFCAKGDKTPIWTEAITFTMDN
jgi:hypothetical protein